MKRPCAATCNLKFTYVLAVGKYYFGDGGYGVWKGIISLYHGVHYHLKEFSDNLSRNNKELFNLCHFYLRIPNTRKYFQAHFQGYYQTPKNEIVFQKMFCGKWSIFQKTLMLKQTERSSRVAFIGLKVICKRNVMFTIFS